MKRELFFNKAIIDDIHKDFICRLFPDLESRFTRRKEFYEFYFDSIDVDLNIELLTKLNDRYSITITSSQIIVEI